MISLFTRQEQNGTSDAIDVATASYVGIQVMGIMQKGARITFEASINNMQFFPVIADCPNQIRASDDVMSGLYRVNVQGFNWLRCSISDYRSGSVTVVAQEQ